MTVLYCHELLTPHSSSTQSGSRVLRKSSLLKIRSLLSVAGHILAFAMTKNLTFTEKFGLILNQSICRLIPNPVCDDPPKLGMMQNECQLLLTYSIFGGKLSLLCAHHTTALSRIDEACIFLGSLNALLELQKSSRGHGGDLHSTGCTFLVCHLSLF